MISKFRDDRFFDLIPSQINQNVIIWLQTLFTNVSLDIGNLRYNSRYHIAITSAISVSFFSYQWIMDTCDI